MQAFLTQVESAIRELRDGKMLILTDHPDRENEGDLVFPAESITPQTMNFIIKNSSGIVCLSLPDAQLKKLGITYMVPPHENTSQSGTPFTISIEAKKGVTTGVSASDRATTILTAVNENVIASDIVSPGHIFPLHAKDGGVLERAGHTEGSIDIVRLAGFQPAAVLCEVMNPDGTMAKGKELQAFAQKHNISILSIADLIAYRRYHENLIADEVTANLPLDDYGDFTITVVKEKYSDHEHVILTHMKKTKQVPLVRIHSACMTGDLFGSKRCDCNKQLHYALKKIYQEGGILIYLNQEGRGIGLFNKIKAYALQDKGVDTVEANTMLGLPIDSREYYIAANILRNKNIREIRLLTNNPQKVEDLQKYGISVVHLEKLPAFCNANNKAYLRTKQEKLNHLINYINEETNYVNP